MSRDTDPVELLTVFMLVCIETSAAVSVASIRLNSGSPRAQAIKATMAIAAENAESDVLLTLN